MAKEFKVAAISSNTNSFGLNRYIFIARDGEAWIGHKSKLYCTIKEKGFTLLLAEPFGDALARMGFEIPERLTPNATPAVVKEVWNSCTKENK